MKDSIIKNNKNYSDNLFKNKSELSFIILLLNHNTLLLLKIYNDFEIKIIAIGDGSKERVLSKYLMKSNQFTPAVSRTWRVDTQT